MSTGVIHHERLGTVTVTVRSNSNRLSARWKNGLPHINVPIGTPLSRINEFLDTLAPKLERIKPAVSYAEGQRFDFPGVSFAISRQRHKPLHILASARRPLTVIEVGSDLDLESADVTVAVSNMMCNAARRMAHHLLLPRANELARNVGRIPAGWLISKGHRTLGQCNARGVISLSYVLVFLPEHLRDFVMLHELAHLSEMNHSPAFHEILNRYLGGHEQQLIAELKAYKWPILRK